MLVAPVGNGLDPRLVAAFLRDHVHPHTAEGILRALRVRAVDELLDGGFLRLRHAAHAQLARPAAHQMLTTLEAVDHRVAVLRIGAMCDYTRIRSRDHDARNQRCPSLERPVTRQDLDLLLGQHGLRDVVLHVYDRRGARDSDCLLYRPHA